MNKKVNSILIDFRDNELFLDKPYHISEMFYELSLYLNKKRGIDIYFQMLTGARKAKKRLQALKGPLNFTKMKLTDYGRADPDLDKKLSKIDCCIGFFGKKHLAKKRHFQQNKKPYVVFEAGVLPDSILLDRSSIFGNGWNANNMPVLFSSMEEDNDIEAFKQYMIKYNISKRTQRGEDDIPDGPFIFMPGQALWDVSIQEHSPMSLLKFFKKVIIFAEKNNIPVVFKPHPGLRDNHPRHGKEIQLRFCKKLQKKHKNLFIVNNSILKICQKSSFMATLNCSSVADAFMCNTPAYCCGRSLYSKTDALIYNKNVEEGLSIMLKEKYNKDKMLKDQNKCLSWLRNYLLMKNLSVEENVKRLEYHLGVKF